MIALYPGAYKPPHRGHFNVVKSLLDNSYNGSIYDKDNYKETGANLLKGTSDSKPKIDKVIVFVGAGERNGISKEESMSIWNIYSKYLGNVEILDGGKNPMFAAKDYAQANPEEEFVSVTGIRGDKDFVDLRRVTTYKNASNVQGLALAAAPDSTTRATDFRNSILSGNLDKITDFFPEDLSREEILQILTDLKDKIVAEILSSNLEGFIDSYFNINEEVIGEKIKCENCNWSWNIVDGGDDLYICHKCGHDNKTVTETRNVAKIPSVQKGSIDYLYRYLSRLVPSTAIIEHKRDSITVGFPKLNEEAGKKLELKDYITSLTEYMIDEGMKIMPLPEVAIQKDEANASNFFGRTAYYDPNAKKIVLYTLGRHDKDIVRSYSHEMVHHMQNIENRLHNINTQNTNEDDRLLELEKEAYLVGNITFRNWEDKLKNSDKQSSLNEGRYDTLSNKLSSIAFEAFKDVHDRGDTSGSFSFRVDHPDEEHDIPAKEFYFDFEGYVEITDDLYQPDGGANAGFDKEGESITPMLSLKFRIPKNPTTNPSWETISFDIKDVVRHEIEHLTQDGDNLKGGTISDDPKLERPSKYMEDDQLLRDLIDADLLPKSQYYKLEKEVDAMLQGLYFKAKKSKQPFKEVIDDYLDKVNLTDKEKKKVLGIWRKRIPALSLPVFEDKQSSGSKFILSDEINLISKELIDTLKNKY